MWLCMPRLDGSPVFDALLGGDGVFRVELENCVTTRQRYIENTAILETELEAADGSVVRLVDFAPRFTARGRNFFPAAFVRRVIPVKGAPLIRVRISPQDNWGGGAMAVDRGVSHLSYAGDGARFRVTSDAPMSYVGDGSWFILDKPYAFVFGPDEALSDMPGVIAEEWESRRSSQSPA
ncbi:MAG: trehalase-like domain-containing protein, partial [Pseudomonadota bacterium]